jgi:hypothetical protein
VKKSVLILLCLSVSWLASACIEKPSEQKKVSSTEAEIVPAPKPAAPSTRAAAPELSPEQIEKIQAELASRASTGNPSK